MAGRGGADRPARRGGRGGPGPGRACGAGHAVPAILACALTGLLVSPISWDHHWVWIAPAVAVAAHYAITVMRAGAHQTWWRAAARWPAIGFWALAAAIVAVYGALPHSLWGLPTGAR